MSEVQSLLRGFRAGMKRDFGREAMPPGSLWSIIDILPDVAGAGGRKRGGYTHASQAISAVTATASYIAAGIFAPFSDGNSILIFDEDGRVYEVESTTGTENIGAAASTLDPVFYSNMVIVPVSDGTTSPKKITRSAGTHSVTALSGSPPAGKYALVYKDVVWLAASSASADRIYFSLAGTPEATWDTTFRYLDVSFPIKGMGAMQNAVFVFGEKGTARIRGSVPPPDSDFIVDDPIFDVGCTDNRSISNWRDKLIWANGNGLYFTDGTLPEDLTEACGMKKWWLDVMAGEQGFATGSVYDAATWSIATEVYGDNLFYSIMNGSTEVDSGLIDLKSFAWIRLRNFDVISAFRRPSPEEVFLCRRGASFLAKLSPIFYPTSATKADADGTNVLPEYESAYFLGQPLLKTIRRVFSTHDLRDAASDNPTLALSYILSPELTSYTSITPTFSETSEVTRQHRDINRPGRGIALKMAQSQPSSDTRFYDLELEIEAREQFK